MASVARCAVRRCNHARIGHRTYRPRCRTIFGRRMGHVERAQTDCSLAATGARHARRRLSRPVERPLIGTFGSHALCPFTQVPERSEEHTSELQSLMRISYAVFCLKKKNKKHY